MTVPNKIPFHPLADLFPLMEGAEFDALVEDIRANGLNQPIRLFDGQILDGRNRYRAMLKLEPDFAPSTFPGDFYDFDNLGRQDALAFVISANVHRRHLTPEQKRGLIATLLKASPEKSDRSIAKIAKVHNETVAAVRKKVEGRDGFRHVDKRTDTNGREQPATKAKRQAKPTPVVQPTAAKPQACEAADPTPAPAAPIDPLAVLQRAWDVAPDAARQLFCAAASNATELRSRLTIAARKEVDERALAHQRSYTAKPAIPDNFPDLPGFLDRSRKLTEPRP